MQKRNNQNLVGDSRWTLYHGYDYPFRMSNRLRELREAAGLSIQQMADQSGYSFSKVQRDETGETELTQTKLKDYSRILKCSQSAILGVDDTIMAGAASPSKASRERPISGIDISEEDTVPIMDYKSGAVLGHAPRHPKQYGYTRAEAFQAPDKSMWPRYKQGELTYVNIGQAPQEGSDCLVFTKDKGFMIREYIGSYDGKVKLGQYNPAKKTFLKTEDIESIHAIAGRA